MDTPYIPEDDFIDVMELTDKIQDAVCDILQDTDQNVAISALMSASANCIIAQCTTVQDAIIFKKIFISILDNSIKTLKIHNSKKPPTE